MNYKKTAITVADDCQVRAGTEPPRTLDQPSIASAQFEMIRNDPCRHTPEDVLCEVYAARQNFFAEERAGARSVYFATSRACLPTSPLAKRYGWGLHSDDQGRLAPIAMEMAEYQRLVSEDDGTCVGKAMRSSTR